MDWIRISTEIGHDPKTVQLARRCGVSVPAAVGHVVMLLANLPAHAADGDLAAVPGEVIEHWAGWTGEDGRLDAAFRALFCDELGVVSAWDRLNGAAIREAEKARLRKARWRSGRQDDAEGEDDPVPSGHLRDTAGQRRDMSRGHAGHERDMSSGQTGHVPGTSAGRLRDMSTVSPVDVDVDVDGTTSQLLAAARVREKSGGDAVPDPEPGNICRLLTAAANRGIAARFGEQPSPLLATHGTTARALQALTEAGVAPDWAAACIEQLASELRTDRPPRSLGYFVPAAIDRWRAEQAHRDAVLLVTPAADGEPIGSRDPLYFAAVKYAREGDAEWIAYCADKGITWQEAA